MKKLEIIIIIAVVSFYVCACSSEYNDEYQDSPVIDETSIEGNSTENNSAEKVPENDTAEKEETIYDLFTEEELTLTIKRAIEDDIWFEDTKSKFYHCINQEIEYEYEITEFERSNDGYITVLPLIEPDNQLSFYYVMSFDIYDGKLRDAASYSGMQDLDELKTMLIPQVDGRGTVSIGERHKPLYDAGEEDIERAKENILRWMETNYSIGGGSNIEDVCIRNFYKDSVETIMFYTYEGKRCCRSVYLSGKEGNKPIPVDDIDSGYVERMMECSFPVGEVPPLDEETENSLLRMVEEKTKQKLKTAIEDDIWFGYEESIFYPYINQNIEYEYYYEYYYKTGEGYIHVLPLIKPDRQSLYYVLGFSIDDNVLNHIRYLSGENLDELKIKNLPEILGSGEVSIGERRKPPYDSDEADREAARRTIRKEMEHERKIGSWRDEYPDNANEIYIRNFHHNSIDTILIYTYEGNYYYVHVYLDGMRDSAPRAVEESQQEYFNRMLECSFPLYEEGNSP